MKNTLCMCDFVTKISPLLRLSTIHVRNLIRIM